MFDHKVGIRTNNNGSTFFLLLTNFCVFTCLLLEANPFLFSIIICHINSFNCESHRPVSWTTFYRAGHALLMWTLCSFLLLLFYLRWSCQIEFQSLSNSLNNRLSTLSNSILLTSSLHWVHLIFYFLLFFFNFLIALGYQFEVSIQRLWILWTKTNPIFFLAHK